MQETEKPVWTVEFLIIVLVPRLGHSEVASPVNTGTCYGVLSTTETGLHIFDAGDAILLTCSLSFLSQAE